MAKLLNARSAILAEVPSAKSLWENGRDHPDIGPRAARDLLAQWAGLKRQNIVPAGPDEEKLESELEEVICDDLESLARAVLQSSIGEADRWFARKEAVERDFDCTDPAESPEASEEIRWKVRELLEDFDRLELAVCAVRKLLPDGLENELRLVHEELGTIRICFLLDFDLFQLCFDWAIESMQAAHPELRFECERLHQTMHKFYYIDQMRTSLAATGDLY